MELNYDVVIIGCGPAGLTAAIYASRANMKTVVLEGETPGGKLTKTFKIENYPGIKEVNGFDLAMQMMEHGQNFGAEIEYSGAEKVIDNGDYKTVVLSDGREFTTKTVIVATGTRENQLALEGADRMVGRGISYCAVCDGAFYRGKDVVVIGGGNSALEESLYLAQIVNSVTIVIRRDVFRAESTIVDKVEGNEKIHIIRKHLPEALEITDNKISGLVIKNVETGELTTLKCSGIFPYIGATPSTDAVKDLGITNSHGYIIADKDMKTAVPGIFAAGDVIEKDLRQVVTATGDGAIAANSAIKFING